MFRLDRVRPAVIADGLGVAAARYPGVPIVFCETRALAQEWAFRFFGAALAEHARTDGAGLLVEQLPSPQHAVPPAPPTTAQVRVWAVAKGIEVSDRGRLRPEVWAAYEKAYADAEV